MWQKSFSRRRLSISIIWVPTLCIVWLKYPPRLGMLFYILSLSRLGSISILFYILSRIGSIRRGLACLSRRGSIRRGLACYHISHHPLAVSSEAWHAILYLIMPWQYHPRLCMLFYILSRLGSISRGLLFYILSRLGSIRRGLACYSISYHALAVSAEAWHAILYLRSSSWTNRDMQVCGSERYLVNMLRRF